MRAAQRLQRGDHGRQRPVAQQLAQRLLQPGDTRTGLADGMRWAGSGTFTLASQRRCAAVQALRPA